MNIQEIKLENEKIANRWSYTVLFVLVIAGTILQIQYFIYETPLEKTLEIFAKVQCFVAGIVTIYIIPDKYIYIKKYIIIYALVLGIGIYGIYNAPSIILLYLIPMALCCRYYDLKFLYQTGIMTALMILVEWIGNAFLATSLDANLTWVKPGSVLIVTESGWVEDSMVPILSRQDRLINNLLHGSIEHLLVYVIFFIAFLGICHSGITMIKRREAAATEKAYIEKELKTAAAIQDSMLPTDFDSYAGSDKCNIYATMTPAKEVGGDFYDFFSIDDKHICIMIGDVSGKGVPASLFMVKAQNSLQNMARMGLSPDEILSITNDLLQVRNTEMFFVSVFIGIIDTDTGILSYASAGHNPPLVTRNDGLFEYLIPADSADLVLGIIPEQTYTLYTHTLQHGAKIFLYTDGVTESRNSAEAEYGEDKLKAFLNSNKNKSPKDLINSLEDELSSFSKDCPQFDDITMLSLELR